MPSRLVQTRTGVLRLAVLLGAVLLLLNCGTLTAESEIPNDLSGAHTLTVTSARPAPESSDKELNPGDVQVDLQQEDEPEGDPNVLLWLLGGVVFTMAPIGLVVIVILVIVLRR